MDTQDLTFAPDKRANALPRELKRRKSGAPPRPPALWAIRESLAYEGEWGSYPKGFIPWAATMMQVQPNRILHVCSGAIPPGHGIRVDIRRETNPDVVADARAPAPGRTSGLPFADDSVDAVMMDPPYSVEYARELYGVEYPRPSHLLEEAARVVKPCGAVAILHFVVPMVPKAWGMDQVGVWGMTTGPGYRIRAWTLYRKRQAGLFA